MKERNGEVQLQGDVERITFIVLLEKYVKNGNPKALGNLIHRIISAGMLYKALADGEAMFPVLLQILDLSGVGGGGLHTLNPCLVRQSYPRALRGMKLIPRHTAYRCLKRNNLVHSRH